MRSALNNIHSNPEKYSGYFLKGIEGNLQMNQQLLPYNIGLCLGKQKGSIISHTCKETEDNKWLYFNVLSAASLPSNHTYIVVISYSYVYYLFHSQ
jgi:hypothetical protein